MKRFAEQSFPMPYEFELLSAVAADYDIAGGRAVTGQQLDALEHAQRVAERMSLEQLLFGHCILRRQ